MVIQCEKNINRGNRSDRQMLLSDWLSNMQFFLSAKFLILKFDFFFLQNYSIFSLLLIFLCIQVGGINLTYKNFIFMFLRIISIFQCCRQKVADRTFAVHCLCKGMAHWNELFCFTAQVIHLELILICQIISGDLLLHVAMATETEQLPCLQPIFFTNLKFRI